MLRLMENIKSYSLGIVSNGGDSTKLERDDGLSVHKRDRGVSWGKDDPDTT